MTNNLKTHQGVLDMCLGLIILVQSVLCVHFNLNGDLTFDWKLKTVEDKTSWYPRVEETESESQGQALKKPSTPPEPDCIYHVPRTTEVKTLLSNMMNVLTKIFTGVRELSKAREWRGRAHEARFHVVDAPRSQYFEQIYSNMTQEFRTFYQRVSENATSRRSVPCGDQPAARSQWRALLQRAEDDLKQAARKLIEQQLRVVQSGSEQKHGGDAKLRRKLNQFLRQELRKVRARQLAWICRRRACFDGLL